MIQPGLSFEFTLPERWSSDHDRGWLIVHGFEDEELIISGKTVEGFDPTEDPGKIVQEVLNGAINAMLHAVDIPELCVTQPLEQASQSTDLDCWTLRAQTQDAAILFFQSVFCSDNGILLVTFEAPNTPASALQYQKFLQTVRKT
ncbi:MAG TPA: hypothetical protein PL157_22675 [Acidobacteriota bacterium]|nr:hypothetical protein [Acidobacteriota bacterium]